MNIHEATRCDSLEDIFMRLAVIVEEIFYIYKTTIELTVMIIDKLFSYN